jgi:hypothetical protein
LYKACRREFDMSIIIDAVDLDCCKWSILDRHDVLSVLSGAMMLRNVVMASI